VGFRNQALFTEQESKQALQGQCLMENRFRAPEANSKEKEKGLDRLEP
jgi:hypothetical protein